MFGVGDVFFIYFCVNGKVILVSKFDNEVVVILVNVSFIKLILYILFEVFFL